MTTQNNIDELMTRMMNDPAERKSEIERAGRIELIFSSLALISAVAAISAFTLNRNFIGWLSSESAGGIAVLCFTAFMAIAAGGGIRRRFASLIGTLEGRDRS